MKVEFDVVVVGAGPAGSTTARLLAERGARVALIEGARLPRDKLCGGGLTAKAIGLSPARALATIQRRVERLELRSPRMAPFEIVEPRAVVAMVDRRTFDLALVEEAASVGVDVRDGEPVREVMLDESGASIRGRDAQRLRARVVVGADGEPSTVARAVGLVSPPWRRALALEVTLPLSPAVGADRAVVAYSVPGGYAWYFPKLGHASVGVLTARPGGFPGLRQNLADFVRELGLRHTGRVRGHWIPLGLRSGPIAAERAVLVGDAAGLADPLFGEGISFALASGHLAAGAIGGLHDGTRPDLLAYDTEARAALGPRLRRLALAARLADVSVTVPLALIRASARVRGVAAGVVAEFGSGFELLPAATGVGRDSR